MAENFSTWKDKLLFWGITAGIIGIFTGGITFGAWSTMAIVDRPSRAEVDKMIRERAPYIEDRRMILDQLQRMSQSDAKLTSVIERNTEAINSLKVELAKLE